MSSHERLKLSVVIATKGRTGLLGETLASVFAADPPPSEVLVVDGDEQRSAAAVVELSPARYLHSAPGLTVQRNRGIEAAAGEVVVFLDDDVEVEPSIFARLARAFDEPDVVGATGRIDEAGGRRFGGKRSLARRLIFRAGRDGTMTSFGYPRRLQDEDRARDVEFMQGCLMSSRRDLAAEIGFDEQLPGYGLAEDEDFSYRLSRRGRLRFVPEAVVRHKNTGFSTSASRRFSRDTVVNRTYLFRKNFHRTTANRLRFAGLVVLLAAHRLVNRDLQGVRGIAEGSLQAWRSR